MGKKPGRSSLGLHGFLFCCWPILFGAWLLLHDARDWPSRWYEMLALSGGLSLLANFAHLIMRFPFGLACIMLFLMQLVMTWQLHLTSVQIGGNAIEQSGPALRGKAIDAKMDDTDHARDAKGFSADQHVFDPVTADPVPSKSQAIQARQTQGPIAIEEPTLMQMGSGTFSVVLACAEEGTYAVKTALKIFDRTPADVLKEIIVVDDGSVESMASVFDRFNVGADAREAKKIKIMRHDRTLGLMIAKKTGGDAAVGDIVVFFDCHVSPQPDYHKELQKLIVENPRRMVVPAITDLDLDTWEEKQHSQVNTKCYLTWDADFNWFDDASPYVPIMSGGLLALSKQWWNLTGGYDDAMRGWGGENLDQSLRSWLCGGEIMRAPSSRVAHMWRNEDPRTRAKYRGVGGVNNRARVVEAWYDDFKVKYPGNTMPGTTGGDFRKFRALQERMHCKPFVHFLHRFRDVYIDGAVIPQQVVQFKNMETLQCLQMRNQEIHAGPCATGKPPASGGGSGTWFHWANQNRRNAEHRCCSGLRQFGSNLCLDFADQKHVVHGYLCDVTGQNGNQQWKSEAANDGLMRIKHDGKCLVSKGANNVQLVRCEGGKNLWELWQEIDHSEPVETVLYKDQIRKEGLSDPVFPSVDV